MDAPPPSAARPRAPLRRLLTLALSAGLHLLFLYGVLWTQAPQARLRFVEPQTVAVLVHLRPPPPPEVRAEAPAPKQAAAPRPEPPKPPPPPSITRPNRAPPTAPPVPASKSPPSDTAGQVTDAQLAGAAGAGLGSGAGGQGAGCDMVRRLQDALRKDRRVQAAVAEANPGRALMVWNGAWVRHGEQEGEGLAAVREAMMWEIGFSPAACKAVQMHGLVKIALDDGPGGAHVVFGAGSWRWSDLLNARARRSGA